MTTSPSPLPGIADDILTSEAALREIFPPAAAGAVAKEFRSLDDGCRAFLAHTTFVALGTTNPDGTGDVSPKGGPPGFIQVLDDQHVAFGELPGNNRLDGYRNLVRDPRIGLLCMVPGVGETLRLNGTGYVARDQALIERCALSAKLPKVVLVVRVAEGFIHCAKALRRAELWNPPGWPDTSAMPTAACVIARHVGVEGDPDGAKTAQRLEAAYATTMWND